MESDADDPAHLAERLRAAHQRVAGLDVVAAEKARITRRLLAINEVSKRSVSRAAERLDALLRDLDQERNAP